MDKIKSNINADLPARRGEKEYTMKKIINGKRYDTTTAERVGEWSNGQYTSDFRYCSEDLYRKRSGEYFLHGEGGALSKYASSSGDSSGWGENIRPLTLAQAQEWAESHLDGDEYEKIFGTVDENSEKTTTSISLTAADLKLIKEKAINEGMTLSDFIVWKCK